MSSPLRQLPRWVAPALLVAGSLTVSLALVEAAVEVVLRHPTVLPSGPARGKPLTLASNYYKSRVRRIVQYLPECALYDPDLTYTLRPGGSCRVVNRDHTVEYSANRAGLRDSDEALDEPRIVVLGDSHAMGAGVDADAAFPKRMEQSLGRPVLNAAISSFGTARQLIMLERLDLPPFETLVIQYCENDFHENRVYVDDGALPILPQAKYDALVEAHRRNTRYYPFLHVRTLLGGAGRAIAPRGRAGTGSETDMTEAQYFLDVLMRHQELIEGKRVVVLELNGYKRDDGKFIAALRRRLTEPRYAALARWVTVIDVSPGLEPADYLVLDGHMRARGHAKVARLLAEELRRRGGSGPGREPAERGAGRSGRLNEGRL